MQVLQRLALLALALVATTLGQPGVLAKQQDIPGIASLDNIGAGCNMTAPYPAPNSRTIFTIPSLGSLATLHFAYFNLPPEDYVIVRTTKTLPMGVNQTSAFTYRGDEKHTQFYAGTLHSDSVTLELVTGKAADASMPMFCKGFTVDKYHYVGRTESLTANEEVCGADNTQEVACFSSEKSKVEASKAVIRLLIHKETGSFFCTGWLVGCEGHVMTNHHCISTQAHASSTEFEFMARGKSCSTSCTTPLGCAGDVRARSSTLILANQDLDYALVKLDINLSNEYGYLTMRENGATLADEIYIPQHPSGWGMRIAAKDDNGIGSVQSVTMGGCAVDQVAYDLDTRAGSSGSPVIATKDNAVVALHHCGGCPNTAINSAKIVADLRTRNILPKCAVYQDSTPAPTPEPTTIKPTKVPTPAPTPAPAPAQASELIVRSTVDGTIFATGTTTSVDYIDFSLSEDADVELDILSMEEVTTTSGTNAAAATMTYVDVNGDCNAAYIDSKIILFRLNGGGAIAQKDVIAINSDAPAGYGAKDGSLTSLDSYMYLPLTKGSYRLAVGTSAMSKADAVAKTNGAARLPRVCASTVSNYGNYRLTVSATKAVQVTPPGTYIGSQCGVANPVQPYTACPYHKEAALSSAVTMDGTIVRKSGLVTADTIPFTMTKFGRVAIEVSSYETVDGDVYLDINGDCTSAYIDPVAYLFRSAANGQKLTSADLINAGDDDENFALRKGRHSISFRDPFFSLALPTGSYVLVVGRYPLSVDDAIAGASRSAVDKFTPESCGAVAPQGNYLVTLGSSTPLAALGSPNSFTGKKCTPSDRSSTASICPK